MPAPPSSLRSLALVGTVPQQLKLIGVVLAFAAATLLSREPEELA